MLVTKWFGITLFTPLPLTAIGHPNPTMLIAFSFISSIVRGTCSPKEKLLRSALRFVALFGPREHGAIETLKICPATSIRPKAGTSEHSDRLSAVSAQQASEGRTTNNGYGSYRWIQQEGEQIDLGPPFRYHNGRSYFNLG